MSSPFWDLNSKIFPPQTLRLLGALMLILAFHLITLELANAPRGKVMLKISLNHFMFFFCMVSGPLKWTYPQKPLRLAKGVFHSFSPDFLASLVAQQENPPAMQEPQETQVQSLSQEDPLEKGMAAHSSILVWKIPWTIEPGGKESFPMSQLFTWGGQSTGNMVHEYIFHNSNYIAKSVLFIFPLSYC